ncbi:virion core protein, T7 gp14 family [Humitalea sp. 24SJ18S-53]|uniref:virion core protein, T7 gp14 family n=1 Tax=Humitalea sp. 24SJ18S-53 TaxID=3422307 RepID=UPI003D67E32D
MAFIIGAAVVSAGVGIAQSVMAGQAASKAASAQQRAQDLALNSQLKDRLAAIQYQEDLFKQDLSYAQETLDYQESEFGRQERVLERNRTAIQKNTNDSIAGIIARRVEEDMSSILQEYGIAQSAGEARATTRVRSSARGVEGNSVEALIQDVSRQEGDAVSVLTLNREATSRGLTRAVIEARTQGAQQLANQQAQTYQPSTPIRTMGPLASINTPGQVAQPSQLATLVGIGSAVAGGFNTYNSWSGNTPAKTVNQGTAWISRQFKIGAPANGG